MCLSRTFFIEELKPIKDNQVKKIGLSLILA